MKKIIGVMMLLAATGTMFLFCSAAKKPHNLWNGKDFTDWTRFIPGDSVDVNTVWMVRNGNLFCKGKPSGFIRTNDSYANYKFHVEWRWINEGGNSGVLLHCQRPDQVWPNCIECQLKSTNAGDLVLIGPGEITVADKPYKNEQQFLIIPKQKESMEKSLGEWNSLDIVCKDKTISCSVNGVEQNKGENAFVTSGPIALQSEGAPIEFRRITLEPL